MSKLHSKVVATTHWQDFEKDLNNALYSVDSDNLVDVKLSTASKGTEIVYTAVIIFKK